MNNWSKLKNQIEEKIEPIIRQIEQQEDQHQENVLRTFREHGVSEIHLHTSTGYGYDDLGRETLEKIYADLFGAEKGLVRPNIVSGTHAISACLYGVVRPGDEMIYLTGKPYDSLGTVIGEKKDGSGSLADWGIVYHEIPLTSDFQIDWYTFQNIVNERTRLICIQRSGGYDERPSFSIAQIQEMVCQIRAIRSNLIIFVDNCYGEFVEELEPTHVGADLIAGSLIKNPGGGIAKSGGYIVGKRKWVEKAATRVAAPGIGMEVGATYGYLRDYYQGLFFAPHIVAQALKGAVFTAALLEEIGFSISPRWHEKRTDIIQQIDLGTAEKLIAFCQGIQAASPIDAHIIPEPAPMPGYTDPIIMAAGTFVQGASIELSADGPLRPPYTAYLQGGLTYAHVKIAIMEAMRHMFNMNYDRTKVYQSLTD